MCDSLCILIVVRRRVKDAKERRHLSREIAFISICSDAVQALNRVWIEGSVNFLLVYVIKYKLLPYKLPKSQIPFPSVVCHQMATWIAITSH